MLLFPILFTFEICFAYVLGLKLVTKLFSMNLSKPILALLFIPIVIVYVFFALWPLDTFVLMIGGDLFYYKGFFVDRDGRINLETFFLGGAE